RPPPSPTYEDLPLCLTGCKGRAAFAKPCGRRVAAAIVPKLQRREWGKSLLTMRRRPIINMTGPGNCLITKALRFLAAAFALVLASSATAQHNSGTVTQVSIDSAERGIVRVVVILDSPDGRMLYGSGSGFVVAPNLVVTAAHVVQAARERPDYGVAIVPPHGT